MLSNIYSFICLEIEEINDIRGINNYIMFKTGVVRFIQFPTNLYYEFNIVQVL